MDSQLGTAARRGSWLAVALAVFSLAAMLMAPLPGALQAALWLAVAWGIRRRQWWAALTGGVVSVAGVAVVVLRAVAGGAGAAAPAVVPAVVIWGLFGVACGYFFLRAALELRVTGKGAAKWPWVALVCGYGLCWLCFDAYFMPSASMEKTLLRNESVLVERVAFRLGRLPRRDELVVFRYPVDPKEVFVKRVAGIPGDRLRLVNKQLFRNGTAVVEPYAIHATSYVDAYRDNFPAEPNTPLPAPAMEMLRANVRSGEVIVPAGKYFVMGDNRDDSADSRYWGFVSANEIMGRPVLIYASYDLESGGTKGMATAFNTRWRRLLRLL
jgi:signal peptidase I